jgi:PAS domain S-box-containing protein
MTGWTKDEVIGETPRILQGPNTDFKIFHDLKEKLERGELWIGRTFNYKKDGTEFYMEWSIAPIKDEHNEIVQYLAVQRDVTKIVRTEQKLSKARREEKKRLREIEETNEKLNELISKQKRTLDLFVKYVPESIIQKSLSESGEDILEGEQLNAALLFCDIRRFTTMAELLKPKEVVHFLNVYYSQMSEVIKAHNGVINQFVGDEIFVSFGAPQPIDEPERSAVRCAQDMVKKLMDINKSLEGIINEEVFVGIGINYGPIIAGNLGSDDRLSYSITGDAVNTAKRIESLTRPLPNAILISQKIFEKTRDIVRTQPLGAVQIKGKNKKVQVYQLLN